MKLTWSLVEPQPALLTVHWKLCVPGVRPVTVDVGEPGVVTTALDPPSTVHRPVAGDGAGAAFSCAPAPGAHTLWSGPALAAATG